MTSDQLLRYIAVPGAISACLTLLILAGGLILRLAKRLARKWILRKRLLRLACGMAFDQFNELLGAPLIARSVERPGVAGAVYLRIYRTPYAYIYAAGRNSADSVNAFAITVRQKSFKLPLRWMTCEQVDLKLTTARFADLGDHYEGCWYVVGANRFGYVECHYYGNPANYQYYLFAHNDVGVGDVKIFTRGADGFSDGLFAQLRPEYSVDSISSDKLSWVRSVGKPNTVAVVDDAANIGMVLNAINVGVDSMDVAHIRD